MFKQPLWIRALPSNVVVNVATLGPLGSLKAPGTWGSAAGLAFYTVVGYPMTALGLALLSALIVYLALVFCGEAEVRMQQVDPPGVILDEFAAIPFCTVTALLLMVTSPVPETLSNVPSELS